jgi:hypothetical protein
MFMNSKETPKRIMRRYACGQFQKRAQPLALGLSKILHTYPTLCPEITAHTAITMMSTSLWSQRPSTRGSGRSWKLTIMLITSSDIVACWLPLFPIFYFDVIALAKQPKSLTREISDVKSPQFARVIQW